MTAWEARPSNRVHPTEDSRGATLADSLGRQSQECDTTYLWESRSDDGSLPGVTLRRTEAHDVQGGARHDV